MFDSNDSRRPGSAAACPNRRTVARQGAARLQGAGRGDRGTGGAGGVHPGTLTTPRALARSFSETRERGWALSVEEWQAGRAGIAAPVRTFGGLVVGAMQPELRFRRFEVVIQVGLGQLDDP
ncbi:IclR family transcriptional regulator domain-containing protein [Paractinoplanes hotanensis]|uniref:IclR family transcriptional regulator domain-containing protein n=1 Tax=Paractinoplanes hotanensis TaxID=2906497 RepID=UPI0034DB33E2